MRAIYSNVYDGTNGFQELAPYFVEYVIGQLSNYFVNGREGFATAGWNVYTTLDYGIPAPDSQLARIHIDLKTGQLTADHYDPQKDSKWLANVGLQQYADFEARRDVTQDFPDNWYCNAGYAHVDYSKPILPPSQNPFADNQNVCWETPLNNSATHLNNAALTAIDPRNGDILAMVGGVDYYNKGDTKLDGGPYNVTLSPKRSMGSSFKPIVYATAFEMGWNPGTIVRDQPTCFAAAASTENGSADAFLCPNRYLAHNYTGSDWAGAEPITYMLGNSLNTPAELGLSFVGMRTTSTTNVSPLITMAQRLGITTLDPAQIGPATGIGTQAVPLLQLTSAYGTFADNGYHENPRSVLEITNADGTLATGANGKPLFPYVAQPTGYQAITPQSAYMITSILTNNSARTTDFGRSNPLHFPGRDVAAKTGTSDARRDIVTMGYTPWLALGVWAGNNDDSSAGDQVIGIAGAGYIFHDVMAFAIDRMKMPGPAPSRFVADVPNPAPGGYFAVPSGMHRAILNCQTGLAAWKGQNVADPKSSCNPSKQERVPLAMSSEFGGCPPPNKAPNPKCAAWKCMGWGCNNGQGGNDPGLDITWIPDGQDPTAP